MGQYLDTRDLYKRQCELQEELDALVEAVEEAKEALDDAREAWVDSADDEDKDEFTKCADACDDADNALKEWKEEYQEELDELNLLENEVGDEWLHGCTLIPEEDFKDYAMDLAEDISGPEMRAASWPLSCIDWDQAADELKMDYSNLEYEGNTYLFRS